MQSPAQIAADTASAKSGTAAPFGKFERTIAWRYLGARKSQGGVGLITGISFACIALAIAAMIIIMSIMNGFRAELVSRILGAQGHVYVETISDTPQLTEVQDITGWLGQQEGVDIAFSVLNKQAFVTSGAGRGTGALVKGISPQDLARLTFVQKGIQFGSFETFGQGEFGGSQVAIGRQMAATLGVQVGDTITLISPTPRVTAFGSSLTRKPYTVSAIFSLGYADADSLYIYMPMQQALLFFSQGEASDEVEVRLDNPDDVTEFAAMVRRTSPKPVYVSDWKDRASEIASALRVEQIAMRFILMIVVIISVFPVVAAMIMLVKNKGKDIAILRTFGTTRASVLRIFFIAGVTIGAAGTLIGLILGVVFCLGISQVQAVIEIFTGPLFPPEVYQLTDGIPAKLVWSEVAMVAFWGFLISSIATFFPARGASKLDPVEALRFE